MKDDRTPMHHRAESAPTPMGAGRAPSQPRMLLTHEDVRRLTLYKWRYSLESVGFTPEQIGRLLFLKWLYVSHAVRG
jgi:hypothetical protein